MLDLQALAFQTDMTRVATSCWATKRQPGPTQSSASPIRTTLDAPWWRSRQNREGDQDNTHHISMLAYLLEKLKNTPTVTALYWTTW